MLTLEFPHLMRLVQQNQFDTIYHEHFSYLSFSTVEQIFARHGMVLFDVEELPTHGGSLRIYGRHAKCAEPRVSERVEKLRAHELHQGMRSLAYYERFRERVHETKRKLLRFLIDLHLARPGRTSADAVAVLHDNVEVRERGPPAVPAIGFLGRRAG